MQRVAGQHLEIEVLIKRLRLFVLGVHEERPNATPSAALSMRRIASFSKPGPRPLPCQARSTAKRASSTTRIGCRATPFCNRVNASTYNTCDAARL